MILDVLLCSHQHPATAVSLLVAVYSLGTTLAVFDPVCTALVYPNLAEVAARVALAPSYKHVSA